MINEREIFILKQIKKLFLIFFLTAAHFLMNTINLYIFQNVTNILYPYYHLKKIIHIHVINYRLNPFIISMLLFAIFSGHTTASHLITNN